MFWKNKLFVRNSVDFVVKWTFRINLVHFFNIGYLFLRDFVTHIRIITSCLAFRTAFSLGVRTPSPWASAYDFAFGPWALFGSACFFVPLQVSTQSKRSASCLTQEAYIHIYIHIYIYISPWCAQTTERIAKEGEATQEARTIIIANLMG